MSRSSARLREKDLHEPETKRVSTRSSSAIGKTGNGSPQQKNAANKNKKNEMNPPPNKPAAKTNAPENVRVTRSKAGGSGGSGKKQSVSNDDIKGGKRKSRSASPQHENEGVRRSTRSKRTVDKLTAAEENKPTTTSKRNKREKASKQNVKVSIPSTSTGRNKSSRNSRAAKKKPEPSSVKLSFDDEYDSLLDDNEDITDEEDEEPELEDDHEEEKDDAEEDEEEEENDESQSKVVTVIQKLPKDKASSKKAEETKKSSKNVDEKTNKKKIYGTNRNSVSSATRSGLVDRAPTIKILEIRVVNRGSNYSIWRKLFVTDEIKATQFARAIVASMGWMGYRDWEFDIHGLKVIVPPDDDDDREEETSVKKYADNVFINEFNLHVNDKLYFNYGIDDNPWVHEITIEAIHDVERIPKSHTEKSHSVNHPVLITGMGACPRDDEHPKEFDRAMEAFCKGPEEFEKYLDKLGEGFDPQFFDKEDVNSHLKICLYDTSKMDPNHLEAEKFFKY